MGGSTFAIGLIPGYKSIGVAAPLLVLLLRLIQGLALGGEYGGAATYVAEHSPNNKRGFYTSFIQTTATFGLLLSLGVVLLIRNQIGIEKFGDWGWRLPFLLSAVLVIVSIYIRLKMKESPMFTRLKSEGKTSVNPLKESFTNKLNLKMVLLALFGATMGQGVVWYTGQFYAQSFIENTCKVNFDDSRTIIIWAIVFATPFFVVFGSLSDKIGRKWIMLLGMLLAVCCYRPIFQYFLDLTDPAAKRGIVDASKTTATAPYALIDAKDKKKVFVVSKFDSVYTDGAIYKFTKTDTVILESAFVTSSTLREADTVVDFDTGDAAGAPGYLNFVKLKSSALTPHSTTDTLSVRVDKWSPKPNVAIDKTVGPATYWMMVLLVFVQILFVTMVYGPIAAFLVELFPTRIRYTSMSLPYHIGNGIFGGLVPFLSTLIITYTKDTSTQLPYHIDDGGLASFFRTLINTYTKAPLSGLLYPIIVASICFVIGALYISPKGDKDISDEVNEYVH